MIRVSYVQPDGTRQSVEAEAGLSVMEAAVHNGIEGIEADCGGACSCATCHVKVSREWLAAVGAPAEIEADMLEAASDVDERSRLSCQIALTPALDGLVVEIPPTQR